MAEPSQAIEAVLKVAEEAELWRRFNRTAWLKSRTGMPYEVWLELQRGAEEPEVERVELKVQAPKEWVVRGM